VHGGLTGPATLRIGEAGGRFELVARRHDKVHRIGDRWGGASDGVGAEREIGIREPFCRDRTVGGGISRRGSGGNTFVASDPIVEATMGAELGNSGGEIEGWPRTF
jgi:hypothetical protein